MGLPALKETYTYKDYRQWKGPDRFELIQGEPVMMAPSPGAEHQDSSLSIASELRTILRKKGSPCRVFVAPFDVVFTEKDKGTEESMTVVQPDVMVICSPEKITAENCRGAPDLIVEVLSPSSAAYDHKIKFDIYEKYGVREYWITDPSAKFIIRHSLNSAGKYERAGVYEKSDFIELFFAEGEKLELSNVF